MHPKSPTLRVLARLQQLKGQTGHIQQRVQQFAQRLRRPKQPDPLKEVMVSQLRSNLREMHDAARAYLPQVDSQTPTHLTESHEISQRIKEGRIERGSRATL